MLLFQGITCKTRELKLHTKPGSQIVSNNAKHCHVWPKDPATMAKQRAENKLTFGKCQLGWPFYHYCGHLFKGSFNTSFPGGVFNGIWNICSSNWIPFPKNQGENKNSWTHLEQFNIENWWLDEIFLKIDGRWTFLSKWSLFRCFLYRLASYFWDSRIPGSLFRWRKTSYQHKNPAMTSLKLQQELVPIM